MRREMKLLLIELNVLRVEENSCAREAERLHALIAEPAPEQMGWPYRVFSHPIRFALSVALGFSAFSFCP